MSPRTVRAYRFGSFEVDPSARSVAKDGRALTISPRVFDLLLYMVRNPGRLLTKEELLKAVWGNLAVEEGNLTQSVFLLRKAFSGSSPIVTVPGRGYQFVAEVEEVSDEPMPAAASAEKEVFALVKPRSRARYFAVAGAVVFAAAISGWFWYSRTVPGDHHEILLADFENTTGDSGFDKALNVALAIDLKQSPFLQVTPDSKVRSTLKLMERSGAEKLATPLAREVCQRINDQAVLSGIVARFGQKYLVTLTASDCISGQDLVQTKAVANTRDNIPQAVDSVAADMRKRLGEPLKSLRSFNKPLLPKETGSLDALKAYTEGHELFSAGKFQESVPLFKRAIELDPRFAVAWGDLGIIYNNLGEPGLSAAAIRKAYELRDLADEPDRLSISASYYAMVTGDLHEAIRNYEMWTEMYARDTPPWINLANQQEQIGRPDLGIEPARRALALDSKNAVAYIVLARAQFATGRLDDAQATCQQAIVQKVDGQEIHGFLFQIAFAEHDRKAMDRQIAWAKGTQAEPYTTLQQALGAFEEGRPKAAMELFTELAEGYRKRGMAERANRVRAAVPRLLAELGMADTARNLLQQLPPGDESTDVLVATAEVGEDARAEALLQEELKQFPEDTLWQYVRGPEVRGAIALSRNKPEEAIEALRPTIPYDLRNPEIRLMRGRAFLAAKQYALAEAEFRKVIDQPTATVDPIMGNLALAHLGLARALALEGKVAVSRPEYEKAFNLWQDAEPDFPALRQARVEYARLAP